MLQEPLMKKKKRMVIRLNEEKEVIAEETIENLSNNKGGDE